MLSRLLIVRLKAAENALKAGRFDEAFRLATEPDIREHRRGAAVLEKLTDRFLARARVHFKADRFTEALLDLTKAEAAGTRRAEIAELRGQVQVVAEEEMRKDNSRRLRLAAARRRIERGSLAGGRQILADASGDDPVVEDLRRQVDRHTAEADQKLDEVERLLAGGQIREAIARFDRARSLDPQSVRATEVEAVIAEKMLARVRQALEAGKVSQAADDLAALGALGDHLPLRRELDEAVGQAGQALRAVVENRFDDALQQVLRLSHLLPKASWVHKGLKQLRELDGLLLSLRASPLGQSIGSPAPRSGDRHVRVKDLRPALAETVAMGAAAAGDLPERLLLLVDGGGSYLLHRGERLSLGRAASLKPADVPVYADLSERHADIARVDDDYFLFAAKEVEVGGRRTRHQLLRSGDRVVLARRAKFTFRLPNRKSSSAVLDMSDSTRLPNDVRRVILFNQTAMMGRGPSAHINCSASGQGLLFYERAGRLWVRPRS
ncbi:MAG: hypothetical protein ACE5GE_15360, partial [Phycisphaerae bacterium]